MYWNSKTSTVKGVKEKININMRCIEMYQSFMFLGTLYKININMRCIEILSLIVVNEYIRRLTLTWDVLK